MYRRSRSAVAAAITVLALAACSDDDDIVGSRPLDATSAPGEETAATAATAEAPEATAECPPAAGASAVTQQFDTSPPFCLDPDVAYSASVETTRGKFTITLDQAAAPQAVNSFVFLARNNYFDDTICHRVIRDFVVQCGDPTATGTGGPGYRFADELPAEGSYQLGSIAMANSGPDTNGSQFFIISGPSGVALPPLYSLFGQVSDDGLGVVETMNDLGSDDTSGVPTEEIRILDVTITES